MSLWLIHIDEDGDCTVSQIAVKDQALRIHYSEEIPYFLVDSGSGLVEALSYEGPKQGNVHRAARWLIDKIDHGTSFGPAGRDILKQTFSDGAEIYRLRYQMDKIYLDIEAARRAAQRHRAKRDELANKILEEKESREAGDFPSYLMHEVDHMLVSVMGNLLKAYLEDDRSLMGQWLYATVDESLALLLEAHHGQQDEGNS